jgi:ATP-dependent Clp protease adaptor protein ClpS
MLNPRLLISNPDTERDRAIDVDDALEKMHKIIIHNDDVTPVDFVIAILLRIFKRPLIIAEAIMWEAHNNGNAVVMALALKEAQTRVNKAHFAARLEGYPLTFTIEPA